MTAKVASRSKRITKANVKAADLVFLSYRPYLRLELGRSPNVSRVAALERALANGLVNQGRVTDSII